MLLPRHSLLQSCSPTVAARTRAWLGRQATCRPLASRPRRQVTARPLPGIPINFPKLSPLRHACPRRLEPKPPLRMHSALTEWPGRLSSPAMTLAQRGFARAWVTVPPGAAPPSPPSCSASPSKRHRPALGSPVRSPVWPRPGAAWQGPDEWPTKPRCRTPSPLRASLPSPSSIRSLDTTPGALPNRRSWSSTAKLRPKVRIYAETSSPLGRACVNTPRRHIPTRAAAGTSLPRVYPSLSPLIYPCA